MLRACLAIAGLALLCALSVHLHHNRRRVGGLVLVASMLSFQAVVHPAAEQAITQQLDDHAEEEDAGDEEPSSLKSQMRHHAQAIRSGQPAAGLVLHLPDGASGNNQVSCP